MSAVMKAVDHAPQLGGDRFIRLEAVLERTSLPRSTLYQMIRRNQFPEPVRLSSRSVAWLESDVNKWIASRVAAQGQEGAQC